MDFIYERVNPDFVFVVLLILFFVVLEFLETENNQKTILKECKLIICYKTC